MLCPRKLMCGHVAHGYSSCAVVFSVEALMGARALTHCMEKHISFLRQSISPLPSA